jgi:serine/threonine-protein kinase RsbW
MPANLRLVLRVPRDFATVCTVRRMVDRALADIGVVDDCRADITLALSEACTNAVNHAVAGETYEVVVTVDRDRCVVEVIDDGIGFDLGSGDGEPCEVTAEHGRGLHLIRAFTDGLELRRIDPYGLAVRMSKTLTWTPDAPATWAGGRHDAWAIVRS